MFGINLSSKDPNLCVKEMWHAFYHLLSDTPRHPYWSDTIFLCFLILKSTKNDDNCCVCVKWRCCLLCSFHENHGNFFSAWKKSLKNKALDFVISKANLGESDRSRHWPNHSALWATYYCCLAPLSARRWRKKSSLVSMLHLSCKASSKKTITHILYFGCTRITPLKKKII